MLKIENPPVNRGGFSTKSRKRKKFKSVDDSSSESDAGNDSKLNPYDLTPTLVALIQNK